jgi:hypothetical protein
MTTSIHIRLEQLDNEKNWVEFKKVLNMDRQRLLYHIKMTDGVFTWNCLDLPKDEKNKLWNYLLS